MPVRLNVGLAEHHAGLSFEGLVRAADTRMYDARLRSVQLGPVQYLGSDTTPSHG